MKFHSVALAAVTALSVFSAHAENLSVTGTIALTDPVFNLSAIIPFAGTAVHYDAFIFGGFEASGYNFRMVATGATFDTVLLLYGGAFNPAAPLTNLLTFNDDFGGVIANGSGFTFPLVETGFYTLVSTAYLNTGVGSYLTTAVPVPEPATYGLMALGLAAIGGLVRRRISA